ncbi:MAG: DUF7577 domain-containing protein [Anaerolineae bacterium]
MRYCPHCGARNPIGVRYCSSCGGDMLGVVGPSQPKSDKSASKGFFGSSIIWLVIIFVIIFSLMTCLGPMMLGSRLPLPTP